MELWHVPATSRSRLWVLPASASTCHRCAGRRGDGSTGRPAPLAALRNSSENHSGYIYIWPSSLTTRCSLPQSRTGRSVRRPGCQSLPCLWVLSERRADTMASSSGRVRLPRSVFGGTSTIPAPVTSTLALWIVSVWSSRAISDEHLATAKPRRAGMLSSADDQSRPRGRWLLFQPYRCAFPSWSGWDAPPWPPHSESGCLGVPRHRAHHLTRSASGSQTGG
jgi:hypothetical protein